MDDIKKNLMGSPARDKFKQLHKKYGRKYMYACDIDFAFVSKSPEGIIAILDYKRPNDSVKFSQVLAFNDLLKSYPVYIVESESPEYGPFFIYQYHGGNWRPEPPEINIELINLCDTWEEFITWEDSLRRF